MRPKALPLHRGDSALKFLALAAFLASAAAVNAQPDPGPPAPAVPTIVDPQSGLRPEPLPPETVVAKAEWGDVTMKDLVDYYRDYLYPAAALPFGPAVPAEEVALMPNVWLNQLAKTYAIAVAAEKDVAKIQDPKIQEEYEKAFETWLLSYVLRELKKRRIDDKLVEPTEEEVAKRYEARKREFFEPFQFHMRHIFLKTYESYTAVEGDTFEGIAERISGDAANAALIRADVDGKPLRWVPPAERAKRLLKPLVVGERLLVPMRPERVAIVRQRMEVIASEVKRGLEHGVSFEKAAEAYSEAPTKGAEIGPLPSGVEAARGIEPIFLEAGRQTPVGQMTGILQGKHGFHLVLITQRTEEGYKPLEKARDEIVAAMKKAQMEKLDRELRNDLFSMPDLKVRYDLFAKAPGLKDEEVVAEVGDRQFTWKDCRETWQKYMGEGMADPDIIQKALMNHGGMLHALALAWSRQNKVFESPEMKAKHNALRTGTIAATHVKNMLEQIRGMQVTEEAVKAYYEERKAKDYRLPLLASYQAIEMRLAPEWQSKPPAERQAKLEENLRNLQAALGTVKSINDFQALASKINVPDQPGAPPPAFPLRSGGMTNAEVIEGVTGEKLRSVKLGEWSQAFIDGDAVRALAVDQRQEASAQAYADVRKQIIDLLSKRAQDDAKPVIEREWLDRARYEFALKDDAAK